MLTVSTVSFQHNTKQPPEPGTRRNIPHYPGELPKLNLVVPGPQIPTAVSTVPPFTHRGTLPVLASKKCQSRLAKVNVQSERLRNPDPVLISLFFIFPPASGWVSSRSIQELLHTTPGEETRRLLRHKHAFVPPTSWNQTDLPEGQRLDRSDAQPPVSRPPRSWRPAQSLRRQKTFRVAFTLLKHLFFWQNENLYHKTGLIV